MGLKGIAFWVDGHVPSKSNARYGRSEAHQAKQRAVKAFEKKVGELAMKAKGKAKREKRGPFPLTGDRQVELYGFGQSADVDNWWKAVLDGMEGVCYVKDQQVVVQHGEVIDKVGEGERHGVHVVVKWLSD